MDKHVRNYMKYSGMAFQLLGAILFGTFIGKWIDGKMQNSQQYATVLGALIGIGLGMYLSLKDFFKKDDSKEKKESEDL